MFFPTRLTAPTDSAVTLDEAKDHLRVGRSMTEEDAEIQGMINAAVKHLDGFDGILGQAIMPQTWSQEYESARGDLVLPFGPVISVESATFDSGAFTEFRLLHDGRGPFLRANSGYSWPNGSAVVVFVAGRAVCPDDLQRAIKLHIGTLYEYRETAADDFKPTMAYEALIAPYRRVL